MPRHETVYPKEMTVTDEGKALYAIWRRVRKNTDEYGPFTEYTKFFRWAMDHYYCLGSRLRRLDETLPYSPDNCTFEPADSELRCLTPSQRVAANKWNQTVNLFRKHFGMKLFTVLEEDELNVVL